MFKGFGTKRQPSAKEVAAKGLKAYENLKTFVQGDADCERLLAQVVMRYRGEDAPKGSEETSMKFARVAAATCIENVVEQLQAIDPQFSMTTALSIVLHSSDEQLAALGV